MRGGVRWERRLLGVRQQAVGEREPGSLDQNLGAAFRPAQARAPGTYGECPGHRLRAEIPEPDNVLYGAITLGVTPVTAANTNVVVEARKTPTGPVVSRYRMGDNPAYGNSYSLELPLEAFLPLADANASRVGALIYLDVRDESGVRDTRTISIAQRGQLVRLDFTELDTDGDGIPDRWESQYFGNATGGNPNADPDGDGCNNLQEFVAGTNPLVADGRHPATARQPTTA